jgi:hypothetical protein
MTEHETPRSGPPRPPRPPRDDRRPRPAPVPIFRDFASI